jgi:hypothetical protein
LCEKVLEDQKIWTENQNRGWRCYRSWLEQSFEKVKNADVKVSEMTIQYRTRVVTVKESFEMDLEQLIQLSGMEHVKAEEIEKCKTLLGEQSTKYMDELKEMSTKCQGIITTSTEELQTAFRIDIRAAVAELKPLADKLQASQGEQAIETAKSFAAKSELYFTKHVTALHHKMRTLYLHHHGADFVIDQLPKLEGSLENASMGLSVIQRQWRQAIYPSLLEKVADASHSSVALQEKEKELKAATEKVQELEGLNKLMRSKVQQRDSELADLMLKNEELKKQLSQNGVVDNDPCDSCLADTYSYVTITPSIMAASTNTTDDVNTTIPDVVGDDAGLETTDTIVKKDVDLSSRSDTEDRPSGGFADSLDGLTSVVPNVVNSGRVEKESTVPVLLSNMKMACQCIKLSSDFYSCLAK